MSDQVVEANHEHRHHYHSDDNLGFVTICVEALIVHDPLFFVPNHSL